MFDRSNLLVVALAVLGAVLGLLVGSRFEHGAAPSLPPGVHGLMPGDQRAELTLPDTSGKQRRLSEWDGKLVILNFWASWCSPCREEMPLLDRVGQEYATAGLEVIGIAIDDAVAVREYLRDAPVRYPILLATTQELDPSALFGDSRSVLPYSVLIGRDGRLLAQRAGSFNESELTHWLKPHL